MSTAMRLRFQAKYLPLVAPFMADRDIRYYLNGIYVTPWHNGVLIAATDGHVLGMVYDERGHADRPVILEVSKGLISASKKPWPSLKSKALRALGAANYWVASEPTGTAGRFRLKTCHGDPDQQDIHNSEDGFETYLQPGRPEIEGKYPDIRKVVPKREELHPGAPGSYNRRFLNKLPHGPTRYEAVQFYSKPALGDEDAPTLIAHLPAIPEFLALIMPMRVHGPRVSLPAWWTDHLQMEAEAAAKFPACATT